MSKLKDEKFIDELSQSGSLALDGRSGVISAKLTRPTYNIDELRRTIDTEITEFSTKDEEETVSISVYNEAIEEIEELNVEINKLNDNLSKLQSEIAELQNENSTLESQIQAKDSKITNLETQLETSNNQISELTKQFQNIIQGMGGSFDGGDIDIPDEDLIKPELDIIISTEDGDNTQSGIFNLVLESEVTNMDISEIKEFGFIQRRQGIPSLSNFDYKDHVENYIEDQFSSIYQIHPRMNNFRVRAYAITNQGKVGYSNTRFILPGTIKSDDIDRDDQNI